MEHGLFRRHSVLRMALDQVSSEAAYDSRREFGTIRTERSVLDSRPLKALDILEAWRPAVLP